MIAAFMLHALAVGALCSFGAWCAERGLAAVGAPRRPAWVLGMLASVIIPVMALWNPGTDFLQPSSAPLARVPAEISSGTFVVSLPQLPAVSARPSLENALAWGWAGLSITLSAIYLATAGRLARQSRRWTRLTPGREEVMVADNVGPAVFGVWRPRVVLPRWLNAASESTRRLVLAHEREHLAARDPQLLAAALAWVVLLPWNLPLIWQLRRLRFALEVDCDSRVLAREGDAAAYGEALLFVSQRGTSAPAGAVALIERPSQLVRRIEIMTALVHRFRKSIVLAAMAAVAACLFAATSITAPALASADAPLKPAPSGSTALALGRHFEQVLADRFPALLEREGPGTAMVVLLLNEDWSVAKAAQVITTDDIPTSESTFGVLGLAKEDVPYVGNMGMQSPLDPNHRVLMVYTERSTPGKRFVSHVFPDTRALDREIYRRYFPQSATHGMSAGEQPWVLLDREGHVLRSGHEPVDSSQWNRTLESRFPGIRTQEITVTPITDDAGEAVRDAEGKELQLHSVWLATGSPPPGA
ncbi:MAG TPA: M56 family metallopeptidase [Steroidobacteraceae bacterium]|nr:M56 family metallopeptidase [Steroidobacteraceae bacterium]